MSDPLASPSRPVSPIVTLFIIALAALFLIVVAKSYKPAASAPQNSAAENLSTEMGWKATPESRRKVLADLREKQTTQAGSYAWVDQKAGVVQLPIARAMELTAEKYGSGAK
jgi:hypothetical protein